MPCLTINGVTVPVFHDSVEETTVDIGETQDGRGLIGNALRTRVGRLRSWRFQTPIMTPANAEAFRKLLEGNGHSWTFVAQGVGVTFGTQLSAVGLAPAVGATWTVAATGGRIAGELTIASANFFGIDMRRRSGISRKSGWDPAIDGWTVGVWRRESGGSFVHTIIKGKTSFARGTANPAGVKQYQNGVLGTYNMGRVFNVTAAANHVALYGYTLAGATAAVEYSDFWILPYEVPDAWPAQIYANLLAAVTNPEFSRLPYVYANGDFCADARDVEVLCKVSSVGQGTANVDGAGLITNARVLEVDMMENI